MKTHILKYKMLKWLCYLCASFAIAMLIGIVAFILVRGLEYVDMNFIFGDYRSKSPTIFPALVGTLYLIFIAIIISTPIGISTAVYLTEYAKKGKLVNSIRVAAETLAAIPSIVYGIFGYIMFVVLFKWGYTLIGGGITLAIMVLPTVIRSTEESLLAVPDAYREGSLALGAGKVRTIFKVVLPNASAGISSAVILAIGRVVSESAVLILTIGMVVNNVPFGPFAPGTSLALDVYYFGCSGYPEQAAATAVVLIVLVIAINIFASWMVKFLSKGKI